MRSNFWEKLKRPVMVASPMSGVSDEAFRLMLLKYGRPDVFWTEFVSAESLCSKKGRNYCLGILKFSLKEHPIVAQIFGADPVWIEKAAKIIAELGFDGIDINMGCPDKNVEKQGSGAALIKNPELAKKIIRAAQKGAPQLPVSVKTRIGYEKNQTSEWIPMLLQENISALTVHLRTKKEMYSPSAHWELASEIVRLRNQYAPKTLILGNGDIKSLAEAKKLIKDTGIDGVMVGRALLGNPWFFSGKNPTVQERVNVILEHAKIYEKYCRNFAGIKKHFYAYAKNFRGAKDLRELLMKVKDAKETKECVDKWL